MNLFRHTWWVLWWLLTMYVLISPIPSDVEMRYNEIIDKFIHFVLFFVLGVLQSSCFYVSFANNNKAIKTVILVMAWGIITGVISELIQGYLVGRDASIGDFIADALGSIAAIIVFLWGVSK